MRKALVSLVLVCLLGAIAVGGELAVRVDFTFDVGPFFGSDEWGTYSISERPVDHLLATVIMEYHLSDWTFGMVGEFGSWSLRNSYASVASIQNVAIKPMTTVNGFSRAGGLGDLTFGVRGVLGAFHLSSYMFFGHYPWLDCDVLCEIPFFNPIDGGQPAFLAWKNLAWTSISGVDLWAMWGVESIPEIHYDNGYDVLSISPMSDCDLPGCDEPSFSMYGTTFGVHGVAGDLEVWAEVNFGAGHLIGLMADWGYDLDYIASTMYYCDWGFGLDGDCTAVFRDLLVIAAYPFGCASVHSALSIGCQGFEWVSFTARDVYFGVDWFYLDDLKIAYGTDWKLVWLDLELLVPEMFCIQPYFSWDLDLDYDWYSDTVIDSIALVGLTAEYSWDGITFLFAERLATDTCGCSDYASITTDARLWSHTSEKEPSTYCEPNCLLDNVDEAFGIEVDTDGCCGGGMFGGVYVFFDHELEDESLFDWFETRAVVEFGIGPNFDVGVTGIFNYSLSPMLKFNFSTTWGTLRIFDHDFFECLGELSYGTSF